MAISINASDMASNAYSIYRDLSTQKQLLSEAQTATVEGKEIKHAEEAEKLIVNIVKKDNIFEEFLKNQDKLLEGTSSSRASQTASTSEAKTSGSTGSSSYTINTSTSTSNSTSNQNSSYTVANFDNEMKNFQTALNSNNKIEMHQNFVENLYDKTSKVFDTLNKKDETVKNETTQNKTNEITEKNTAEYVVEKFNNQFAEENTINDTEKVNPDQNSEPEVGTLKASLKEAENSVPVKDTDKGRVSSTDKKKYSDKNSDEFRVINMPDVEGKRAEKSKAVEKEFRLQAERVIEKDNTSTKEVDQEAPPPRTSEENTYNTQNNNDKTSQQDISTAVFDFSKAA